MTNQLSRITALRDVASEINSDSDLDSLLRNLIRAACVQGNWDLGGIMAVDLAHGFAYLLVRFETSLLKLTLADRWELATSPSLVALQSGEPVFIRDAQVSEEFPGYRRDAIDRGYRTVLILPMSCIDAQGRPMVVSVSSRKVVDVSAEDLAFMGAIVRLGAIAVDRAHRHHEDATAAEQMRRVLAGQSALLHDVLAGASMSSLTETLSDMLNTPVVVLDFFSGTLLGSASPLLEAYDDKNWRKALAGELGKNLFADVRRALGSMHGQPRAHTTHLHIGDTHRVNAHVEPLTVDDETVGALVTFGTSLQPDLHRLMADSAKFALSVQLMRSVIRFRFETRTLSELFFEVVERRWRDETDVVNRARHLGLDFTRRMRMLVVDFPDRINAHEDRSAQCHRVASNLAEQLKIVSTVVTFGGGLVCLLPHEEKPHTDKATRFAERLSEHLHQTLGREPIVVLGDSVEGMAALATEWERCWRMIRIARTFNRSGPMTAPDLGPLPLLIGAADSTDVRSFVDGALGRVIAYDRKNASSDYLRTLTEYVRSGCRAQACADAMELHVTTLRYRLSRIADLFGIEVETPEQRFSIELALNLHQLVHGTPRGLRPKAPLDLPMPRGASRRTGG